MALRNSIDIDGIMYQVLTGAGLLDEISGGIYVGDTRPLNSEAEDIVINTLTLTTDSEPQSAVTNVNVYCMDIAVKANGDSMNVADRARLNEISAKVDAAIRGANVEGILITPQIHTVINDESRHQHYCNIRCGWNISSLT